VPEEEQKKKKPDGTPMYPNSPAHSGDLERSFRSIMNTDSGDHEHPHEPA
jgi:hypothetical protein